MSAFVQLDFFIDGYGERFGQQKDSTKKEDDSDVFSSLSLNALPPPPVLEPMQAELAFHSRGNITCDEKLKSLVLGEERENKALTDKQKFFCSKMNSIMKEQNNFYRLILLKQFLIENNLSLIFYKNVAYKDFIRYLVLLIQDHMGKDFVRSERFHAFAFLLNKTLVIFMDKRKCHIHLKHKEFLELKKRIDKEFFLFIESIGMQKHEEVLAAFYYPLANLFHLLDEIGCNECKEFVFISLMRAIWLQNYDEK